MSGILTIGGRMIGQGHPTFIIAEAGANHNGDLRLAHRLIDVAADIGVDCIKFQTFSAAEFCSDRQKTFTYLSQGKEVTESEFEMFQRLEFSRESWMEIIAHCRARGMPFVTTVQDRPNLEMLQEIGGLAAIKVGSDDFDHLENLGLFADSGLPLILSKGMAGLGEVDRVLRYVGERCRQLAVLHCVSLYPSDPALLNIRQIQTLSHLFPHITWGFSDHSQGTMAASIAVAMGAVILEKHFTLDHDLPGPDHWFSMDVVEMRRLVEEVRFTEAALGNGQVRLAPGEEESRKIMRRRLVAKADLAEGTRLTLDTVTFKRAEQGAFLDHWSIVQDRVLRRRKRQNEGIDLDDISFG